MAPQRNSGENSGPQNISYTASGRVHQDISPKRPYLNTWKDAQHHYHQGNTNQNPRLHYGVHTHRTLIENKTDKNRPIPRTKQKTKSTGEDVEKQLCTLPT